MEQKTTEQRETEREREGGKDEIESGGRTWPLPEGARRVRNGDEETDTVDEASRESFPASDPPGFTPPKEG